MRQELMRKLQRSSDSVWSLPARASMTLQVGPGPRIVHVRDGRLWLTASGTARDAAIDVWLAPGDALELPSGLSVVMEAWPDARFELLVPPKACLRARRQHSRVARVAEWAASAARLLWTATPLHPPRAIR